MPEGAAITAGARVWIDGAGWGTVVVETSNSKVRVRLARNRIEDFSRDQLRVVASDDAAPASPATEPLEELAATAPAPTPDDALDAAAAPAPVAPPCADPVEELMTLVQSIRLRGRVPPGYESEVARALELLRVVDAAERAGDDAAQLRPVHAAQAALPSPTADLFAPPAARPHAVEMPPAPAPMAMESASTASPEPIDDVAAAPSPAADLVAPPAPPQHLALPATQSPVAPPPVAQARRAAPPRPPRRQSAREASRGWAPSPPLPREKPPPRRKRKAPPSVASPEPTAPDASASAQGSGNTGRWATEEDERLLAALRDGLTAWSAIAARVGTRDAKKCRERYANHLDPTIKKGKWSDDENKHLVALSESDLPRGPRGIDWERVAASLPTVDGRRKGPDVKTKYHALKKRKR